MTFSDKDTFSASANEIPGFPGYRIATDGGVWSCWKKKGFGWPNFGTTSYMGKDWRRLAIFTDQGYKKVNLGSKGRGKRVHRLLAQAFIPRAGSGPMVLHIDGNSLHNCVPQKHCGCGGNLYWGTAKQNSLDALKHGTHQGIRNRGENCGKAKLTAKQVRVIKWALHFGSRQAYLVRVFKVAPETISGISRGKRWRHVVIF